MLALLVPVALYLFLAVHRIRRARPGSVVWSSDRLTLATSLFALACTVGLFLDRARVVDVAAHNAVRAETIAVAVILFVPFAILSIALARALRHADRDEDGWMGVWRDVDYGIGPDRVTRGSATVPYRDTGTTNVLTRGSPRLAARAIGGNLAQSAALVASCVGFLAIVPSANGASASDALAATKGGLDSIRHVELDYQQHRPGVCIDAIDLRRRGLMVWPANDAWGSPISISCWGDDVSVRSAGPDREIGTPDDVVVGPAYEGGENLGF